jgi:hypothetical protein
LRTAPGNTEHARLVLQPLEQHLVGLVRTDDLDAKRLLQVHRPAGMVDMAVRQPDRIDDDAVFVQRLADLIDIPARVDHDTVLRFGIEQNRAVLLEQAVTGMISALSVAAMRTPSLGFSDSWPACSLSTGLQGPCHKIRRPPEPPSLLKRGYGADQRLPMKAPTSPVSTPPPATPPTTSPRILPISMPPAGSPPSMPA